MSELAGLVSAAALALAGLTAASAQQLSCGTLQLPHRASDARTGSQIATDTATLGGRARQRVFVEEILEGNVPDFLRTFVPVVSGDVTFWTLPDYMAVGSEDDFLRVPLTMPSIRRLATELELLLPTPKMVDLIHQQAAVRVEPQPLSPGPKMRSSGYYLRHQQLIEDSLAAEDPDRSALVSGHKKDVVIAKRLYTARDRIAIYGWHRNGRPIQPLSTVHGARYADYSHGIRWVCPSARLLQEETGIAELLSAAETSSAISDQGPFEVDELLRPRSP